MSLPIVLWRTKYENSGKAKRTIMFYNERNIIDVLKFNKRSLEVCCSASKAAFNFQFLDNSRHFLYLDNTFSKFLNPEHEMNSTHNSLMPSEIQPLASSRYIILQPLNVYPGIGNRQNFGLTRSIQKFRQYHIVLAVM